MNRAQLQHVLRAASGIVVGSEPVVIGSQAVLGSHDEADLPIEATRSIEADICFLDDADEEKADQVDGAIGELSRFHAAFGYYAQGVGMHAAVLPAGWKDRLVRIDIEGEPAVAWSLEPHDCVVSKLVADRVKDREFGSALIGAGVVDPSVLLARVQALPDDVSEQRRAGIRDWIRRQAAT